MVLIEYKGKTRLAAVNDVVEGWTLTSAQDKEAQFVKGERGISLSGWGGNNMQTKALSWKMWLGTTLVLLLTMTNAVGAQELSFYFENASYRDIFTTIGEFAGLSVLIDDGVSGSGTVEIKNRSLEEALDLVAELSGCTYSITDSSLLVGLKSTVEQYEKRSIRLVTVKHVEPQTLVEMLSRIFC